MENTHVIAVTGKSGSGKSKFVKLLSDKYYESFGRSLYTVDMDNVLRRHIDNMPEVQQVLANIVGIGKWDRELYVKNLTAKKLEEVTEYLKKDVIKLIEMQVKECPDSCMVMEVSALQAYGLECSFHEIIYIYTSKKNCRARLSTRGTPDSLAQVIEEFQKPHTYRNLVNKMSVPMVHMKLDWNQIDMQSVYYYMNFIKSKMPDHNNSVAKSPALKLFDGYPNVSKALEMTASHYKDFSATCEFIFKSYTQPHRFYHNLSHIESVLDYLNMMHGDDAIDALLLAALFHDVVYDPKESINEKMSLLALSEHMKEINPLANTIIHSSTYKEYPTDPVLNAFAQADLSTILSPYQTVAEIIKTEKDILKEYQHVSWPQYQKARISVLEDIYKKFGVCNNATTTRLNFLASWEPRIALYPGSFNPFHVGHLDVLKKAEMLFDKVILGFAYNPDKDRGKPSVPSVVANREVAFIEGLLADYIKSYGYPLSIVKGIRNSVDLSYEQQQLAWVQESIPDQQMVFIPADPKLAHVSSTAIRNVIHFGGTTKYKL